MKPVPLFVVFVLAGCANGPWYWTRAEATREQFNADHDTCAQAAMVGYGVGSEQVYKRCLASKGWTRVQGRGTQPLSVPHFRGIEDDDHFAFSAPRLQQRSDEEITSGREQISGEALQCARSKRTMSQRPAPGVVCP